MRSQIAATALASAVLTVMVGSALGRVDATQGLEAVRVDEKFAAAVDWFATHPSEFRTFLRALQDGDNAVCESIVELAGLSSTDLTWVGRQTRPDIHMAAGTGGGAAASGSGVKGTAGTPSHTLTPGTTKRMIMRRPTPRACW